MAERKTGIVAAGAVAGITIVLLAARAKAKPPTPPGEEAALKIEVFDSEGQPVPHNSPFILTEGQSYTVVISVTNKTTRGGIPWEATLGGYAELAIMRADWPMPIVLFSGSLDAFYIANETKQFNFPFNIPVGYGESGGEIIAAVTDPTGIVLASASEPTTIASEETVYAAEIVIGV